jgi:hypothetical protein
MNMAVSGEIHNCFTITKGDGSMKSFISKMNDKFFLIIFVFLVSGCSSVMQKTQLVERVEENTAMVNVVRSSIFVGDGVDYDLWDGNKFIGVLGAGTIVQYRTKPGAHVFMAKGRNWAYVKADIAGGKRYFIKGNMLPFGGIVLSAIEAQKDGRTKDWLAYQPKELIPGKDESYAAGKKAEAEKALKDFYDGHAEGFDLRPEHGI